MIFKNFADQDWIGLISSDQVWTRTEKFYRLFISANLPKDTAKAKQCQVVSLRFIATELFFQFKKISKVFFNISGRLGEIQLLKISSAAHPFNLSGPPKIRTINGPAASPISGPLAALHSLVIISTMLTSVAILVFF